MADFEVRCSTAWPPLSAPGPVLPPLCQFLSEGPSPGSRFTPAMLSPMEPQNKPMNGYPSCAGFFSVPGLAQLSAPLAGPTYHFHPLPELHPCSPRGKHLSFVRILARRKMRGVSFKPSRASAFETWAAALGARRHQAQESQVPTQPAAARFRPSPRRVPRCIFYLLLLLPENPPFMMPATAAVCHLQPRNPEK